AGTVGIVSFIEQGYFYFAHIGDCSCFIIRDGTINKLTRSQTAELEQVRKLDNNLAVETIRRDIRNVLMHPGAFGVYTGEDAALKFVQYGSVRLAGNETVIIASDGLDHVIQEKPDLAQKLSPTRLIKYAEQEEQTQGLRSDDKSIIVL